MLALLERYSIRVCVRVGVQISSIGENKLIIIRARYTYVQTYLEPRPSVAPLGPYRAVQGVCVSVCQVLAKKRYKTKKDEKDDSKKRRVENVRMRL